MMRSNISESAGNVAFALGFASLALYAQALPTLLGSIALLLLAFIVTPRFELVRCMREHERESCDKAATPG
jgi:hypothetical protein